MEGTKTVDVEEAPHIKGKVFVENNSSMQHLELRCSALEYVPYPAET